MDYRKEIKIPSSGFTLIELLTVIAIVGLLGSIIFAIARGSGEQGRIAKGLYFSQHLHNSLGSYIAGIWSFDEGSGSSTIDTSGWDNHGTINGATYTSNTPSGIGYALSFNGVNNYVGIGSGISLSFGTQPFTVEAWVNLDNLTGNKVIIGNRDNAIGGYYVAAINQDIYYYNQGGSAVVRTGPVLSSALTWYHVVFVRDGSNSKMYLNGVLQTLTVNSETGQNLSDTGLATYIGKRNVGTGDYFMKGLIDEVRIYNSALTAVDIQQLYAESATRYHIAQQNL
ncbi:MAG: prepilin-type N-terminal cleavage/methylation domain-containing protein [Dehalococcoidales bacterium]|nr:prepilin-type N-terminal cleavage/methylation domain-containing protein [Dehalococcoidales bacterium]